MRRALQCLLLGCLVFFMSDEALAADTLIIATEGQDPPFNFFNERGELTGFDVEIARALCEEMQTPCEFVTKAWDDLLPALEKGEADLVMASMAKTRDRERHALFSQSYYRSYSAFIGDPARFSNTKTDELKNLRIATASNSIQQQYIKRHYPEATLLAVASPMEAYSALRENRADVVMGDAMSLLRFLTSPQGQGYDFMAEPSDAQALKATAHIAVSKLHPELLDKLNNAIESIRLNGEYDRVSRRYFPFSAF
ncbi:transporter substrate-binding domain-containing protein [Pokkaliibacter sp. CJK22405]|uniref:transporter substrate-binding domain-containing protein n=1 Tax=Pokkaliibacter sp. CJK22405 TaxID=3384615 RepID=UPI003984CA03